MYYQEALNYRCAQRGSRRDGELRQGAFPSVIYKELRHDSTAAAKNEWHIGHRLPRRTTRWEPFLS